MRGFKLTFHGGDTVLINSDNGTDAGTIIFEEFDELVGVKVVSMSEENNRPRKIGFTLMRNA